MLSFLLRLLRWHRCCYIRPILFFIMGMQQLQMTGFPGGCFFIIAHKRDLGTSKTTSVLLQIRFTTIKIISSHYRNQNQHMWGPPQHMMPPYAAFYPHGGCLCTSCSSSCGNNDGNSQAT
ncbi:unnamed protein product [Lactuca virosa]|uniref:Secreted protein n=1 Tax=Lactuca virosa TaxID=75947 RepID=A0AAU9M212_9ASTR|nr:unnamed protein product [Lactuca virosa]